MRRSYGLRATCYGRNSSTSDGPLNDNIPGVSGESNSSCSGSVLNSLLPLPVRCSVPLMLQGAA